MTVSYSGLWKMLQENGLRKQNLVDDVGLSPVTVSKMGKGRMVNDKIIDRICEYLKSQPRDMIEIEEANSWKAAVFKQGKNLYALEQYKMNMQIFGTKKTVDTRKAERYFRERRIKLQSVDLK